jgi:hypothetical protein
LCSAGFGYVGKKENQAQLAENHFYLSINPDGFVLYFSKHARTLFADMHTASFMLLRPSSSSFCH